MSVMSIREFNSNVSAVLARVEKGEIIELTRNGKPVAELRPKLSRKLDDPEYRARWDRFVAGLEQGVPGLTGPASYDERTAR